MPNFIRRFFTMIFGKRPEATSTSGKIIKFEKTIDYSKYGNYEKKIKNFENVKKIVDDIKNEVYKKMSIDKTYDQEINWYVKLLKLSENDFNQYRDLWESYGSPHEYMKKVFKENKFNYKTFDNPDARKQRISQVYSEGRGDINTIINFALTFFKDRYDNILKSKNSDDDIKKQFRKDLIEILNVRGIALSEDTYLDEIMDQIMDSVINTKKFPSSILDSMKPRPTEWYDILLKYTEEDFKKDSQVFEPSKYFNKEYGIYHDINKYFINSRKAPNEKTTIFVFLLASFEARYNILIKTINDKKIKDKFKDETDKILKAAGYILNNKLEDEIMKRIIEFELYNDKNNKGDKTYLIYETCVLILNHEFVEPKNENRKKTMKYAAIKALNQMRD